jgi:hypothetical protein
LDDGDHFAASQILLTLESEAYRNENDWKLIWEFCRMRRFDARLELITKALIRAGGPLSAEPYLVLVSLLFKSGRREEARPYVEAYKKIVKDQSFGKWDIVNLFFKAELYEDCIAPLQDCLHEHPKAFYYLGREVDLLWKLNDHAKARKKLHGLVPLVGDNPAYFAWVAGKALEFRESALAQKTIKQLITMLEQGRGKISKDVIYILKTSGNEDKVRPVLVATELSNYEELSEMEEIFEAAVIYGVYKTAKTFGMAILEMDKNHHLRPQIERLRLAPDFLMS